MKLNLTEYINYRVKILLKDKRWLEGNMLAVDSNTNIVLDDTYENRKNKKNIDSARRFFGLVVIRGDYISNVEILCKPDKDVIFKD